MNSIKQCFSKVFPLVIGRLVSVLILAVVLSATEARSQSLTVQVRPTSTPAAGSVSPTSFFTITNLPQTEPVTADESNPAYAFDHWELVSANVTFDLFSSANDPSVAIVVTDTNSPALVRAFYRSRGLSLIVTADPSNGGYTSNPGLGTNWFGTNASVSITATASNGYNFVSWGGAASGSANPATFNMNFRLAYCSHS